MIKVAQWVLILTIGLLLGGVSDAQDKKSTGWGKGQIKIPVWVEDETGKFWDGGRRQSFKVYLDGAASPVKSFLPPDSPTIILVVFDTVEDLSRVDMARTALINVLETLNEQYWIGLMRAQDGLTILQEPTADRAALTEKIRAIEVKGKAGLLDTLEPVSRLGTAMLRKSSIRLAVLYVTDSSIAHYRADYLNPVINSSDRGDLSRRFSDRAIQERVSRFAESLGAYTVPIFMLHLAHRSDALNLAYQSGLERIATATGGSATFCRTTNEIEPALVNMIEQIKASYLVGVDAPEKARDLVKIKIAIESPEGKTYTRIRHTSQITKSRN